MTTFKSVDAVNGEAPILSLKGIHAMPLEKEIQTFNANLTDWLKQYRNRVVLIQGDRLVGTFDNEQAAIEAGARQFGMTPFLVRRVLPAQEQPAAPALTLGVLRAGTAFHPSSM